MLRLLPLVLLVGAASACASQPEPAPKPSAAGPGEPRLRRADSLVEARPAPAARPGVQTDTLALALGDARVTVLVHTAAAPGGGRGAWDALSVHDDEDTAVEAALGVLARRGGRVVELRHTGARLLAFPLGGATYTVDPNRIFTDAGRARTLATHSADTPAARAAVAAFADALLALYTATRPDPVVTLHNNTDGAYSVESYRPGAEYARDAARVARPDGVDADDFFFVAGAALYDRLLRQTVAGVVLQNDATATDDGSLSVWAARAGVPYVNAEAQHGHRAVQARMLEALADALEAGAAR